MSDDLVKRLRNEEDGRPNCTRLACYRGDCGCEDADRLEAADRIERLEAEVRMTSSYDRQMQKLADDQAARIEALEVALTRIVFAEHNAELSSSTMIEMADIARAALGEKHDE